jgi:hypothetical protein
MWKPITIAALMVLSAGGAAAQEAEPTTREQAIVQEQADKDTKLHPFVPTGAEKWANKAESILTDGMRWHPFFENAYSGGGFTLGAGYAFYLGSYNFLDVRGSYTISGYKRLEAEYVAPRLFNRRGHLSVLGGWRDATQVGFFGIGGDTSDANRTNYRFTQPYGSALLTFWPTRHVLVLRGGAEYSQWTQKHGEGPDPSVEEVYTPATLPGLGAKVTYLHSQAGLGLDWLAPTAGYARRGTYLGVTGHDYHDRDGDFGFQQVGYEAIQHIPILREAWVISLHAKVETAFNKSGQEIPFFMLPSVGGGSSLRGFSSWRFRDNNSLLLQAEWRIMLNRFLDAAFFYDAGKVTSRTSDLDFNHLRDDFGFGLRFHNLFATPLRVEVAKSNEGLHLVFSSSAAF